ncbi:hypothetical protein BDR04DRAFT_1103627 [Suillus decipiens]|nr:hypothetical protein BDR04DRAFT_1103627 [Suillus decipiens]
MGAVEEPDVEAVHGVEGAAARSTKHKVRHRYSASKLAITLISITMGVPPMRL